VNRVPYERVIQWVSGPLAAAIGYGATKLVHANISHATALSVATFITTSAAVYLGHYKWMSNVPKWWEQVSGVTPSDFIDEAQSILDGKPETAVTPDAPVEAAQLPVGTS
jgi:hypothetical protein